MIVGEVQSCAPKVPPSALSSDDSISMNVQVSTLSGATHALLLHPSATLAELKALISEQLACAQVGQQLLIGDTPLLGSSSTTLAELGVSDGTVLTLLLSSEPLGQSLLPSSSGKMVEISKGGSPEKVLNEFQHRSWLTAWAADSLGDATWACNGEPDEEEPWGNVGYYGVDFHWTMGSDGCRYEYWFTAPGDNEYGILVRIDATSMKAVASGSDDGLELFDKCGKRLSSLLDLKSFVGGRFLRSSIVETKRRRRR